jgi:hypothetical protein
VPKPPAALLVTSAWEAPPETINPDYVPSATLAPDAAAALASAAGRRRAEAGAPISWPMGRRSGSSVGAREAPGVRCCWPVNPRGSAGGAEHAKTGPAAGQADERARLSTGSRGLLGRSDDVCRRKEPPRDESGLRAHGSNQRFHRLQRHAVARALTTAPSLTGVSPTAEGFSSLMGGGASAARHAVAQRNRAVGCTQHDPPPASRILP